MSEILNVLQPEPIKEANGAEKKATNTDPKEDKKAKEEAYFKLSYKNAQKLFYYFLSLMVIAIGVSLIAVLDNIVLFGNSQFNKAITGSIASSTIGATIYYSRKLYKYCINQDITHPNGDGEKMVQLGVVFYLLLRPLFAMGFAILTVLLIKSGLYVMTAAKEASSISPNFVFVSMILSFFVGYSSSDFIDALGVRGKKVADSIANKSKLE